MKFFPTRHSGGLTPIILATQEAEIRRITVRSQPWANSSWDPIPKKRTPKISWWSGSSSKTACLARMSSNPSAAKNKQTIFSWSVLCPSTSKPFPHKRGKSFFQLQAMSSLSPPYLTDHCSEGTFRRARGTTSETYTSTLYWELSRPKANIRSS
jgi:hypothetical protein